METADLYTRPEWIGLAGVVLGFVLAQGTEYLRYRLRIHRLKTTVEEELEAIQAQLSQKKDILKQAIEKLEHEQILPTISVHVVSSGYRSALSEIYGHLKTIERNCLHVIYEYLRVGDEVMDRFDADIKADLEKGVMDNPYRAYAGRLQDILDTYEIAERLIESYLSGNPGDVFHSRNPPFGEQKKC